MLYIKGKRITDYEYITLDTLKRISKEGNQKLRKMSSELDSWDKALIAAADNVLLYHNCAKGFDPVADIHELYEGLSAAIGVDYISSNRASSDKEQTKRKIAERIACALFFKFWNVSFDADPDENGNTLIYKKIPTLSYNLNLGTGEMCFGKIGYRAVHPDDPSDEMYLDLLKLGKETIENDFVDLNDGEGGMYDAQYFAYRVTIAIDKVCRADSSDIEVPKRMMDVYKNND